MIIPSRFILLLALAVPVAGCASSSQVAQRNEDRCAARGLQPETDAFNDCVVRMESERQERMDNRRRDMMEQSATPWGKSDQPWSR